MLKDFEGKELECCKLYYFCNTLKGEPFDEFSDYEGKKISGVFLLISFDENVYLLLKPDGKIIKTFGMATRCFKRVYE